MTTILDPTNEKAPVERQLAARQGEISGRLAILDIAKPRGNILLDKFEVLIAERLPNVTINRYRKPTFTKPAPDKLRAEIKAENDFLIEGLAD